MDPRSLSRHGIQTVRRCGARALLLGGAICLSAFAATAPVLAQDVRIGIRNDPSLDPHFMFMSPNIAIFMHIFGSLTTYDHDGKLQPYDAQAFRMVDDMTWEFKLRPDIRLKSGGTLQADDIVFSFDRIPRVPNNASPYTPTLQSVSSVEVIDPLTVRVHTNAPNPYVAYNLASTAIIPRAASQGHGTGDFNILSALDEYGPFRVVSFKQGDTLVLQRNPSYFGEKPYWQTVTLKIIVNDAARVAALEAGDVDFIDFVPPGDAARLRAQPRFAIHDGLSWRVISMIVQVAPGVGGVKNPLQDVRVRQAVSMSIDRQALADRLMDGEATPASEVAVPGMDGYDPTAKPIPYDPAAAKTLLVQAGYDTGFPIKIVCSSGRYVNDSQVCQALGQMMSRIGLRPTVEAVPFAVLFAHMKPTNGAPGDFDLGMIGLGAQNPLPGNLYSIARTADPKLGFGFFNFGQFSDPALDHLIDEGARTMDPQRRNALLQQAVTRVRDEVPMIPLYFQKVVTASRAGLTYLTDPNEDTLAYRLRPN